MLLPSALPCDVRPPLTRSHSSFSRLLCTSPPLDSGATPSPISTGIYQTCRALQSLLGVPTSSSMPSPPLRAKQTLQSPVAITYNAPTSHRARVTKRQQPPRSSNKRRRDTADDGSAAEDQGNVERGDKYSTPKRQRLAPPVLPLGLEPSDFESLELPPPSTPAENEDTEEWNSADDHALVALVLEKLKLSRRDWNDCARWLGRDKDSIGARWKVLLGEGDVGLRRGRKVERGKIEGVWM